MKKTILFLFTVVALLSARTVSAQVTVVGSDPASLRWFQIESPSFRIIYPTGTDSLARVYLHLLEQYRPAEARSSGLLPGSLQWGKTPVVLHPYNVFSNGMMLWTPKRMDLYTNPEPYKADPLRWETQLAVHESRHLAQLQFGYRSGLFRALTFLTGEIWPGAASAIYPNMPFLEGDAVVAETALTRSGRGRTADFLNYYHVAFDQGDWRDWYRWRYGSFRKAAPDYYAAGYLTLAGLRYFYDDPLFVSRYFDTVSKHPLRIGNFARQVKALSGKSFSTTFQDIMEGFHAIWAEEAERRGPFMPMEQVTAESPFATDYEGGGILDGRMYLLKHSLNRPASLITLDPDGTEHAVRPFATTTSRLFADETRGRLYWSEPIRDPRWELGGSSRIRYYDAAAGQVRDLTRQGRYFNPQPSPDGVLLAAAEYPVTGGTALVLLSADDGHVTERFPAPDGIQLCEFAWLDGTVWATGLSDEGYGIYRLDDGAFACVLGPAFEKTVNLNAKDGLLQFISDRTGVNELYQLDPRTLALYQCTASRYGISDVMCAGDTLYYPSQTQAGHMVFRTAAADLKPFPVRYEDVHKDRIAETLSAQEKALAGEEPLLSEGDVPVTEPARYRKLPHLVNIHSWAPIYVNYDNIESFSFDFSYRTAWLGATAFFQNTLGTAYGSLGYSPHPDPSGGEKAPWRHSGHLRFTYAGLYPVVELSADFNDRSSLQYAREIHRYAEKAMVRTTGDVTGIPAFSGTLRVYIPLSFSSGGWRRGLVPQVTYGFTNDRYSTGATIYTYEGEEEEPASSSVIEGNNVFLQSLSASIRGYVMRPTAPSQAYPSLGIGAEVGFSGRPGVVSAIAPVAYGYLYGYLPGLFPAQGLRLTAMVQRSLDSRSATRESRVNVLPRGFETLGGTALMNKGPWQARLTADYAIPIYAGDLSFLSPVVYISHFLLTPHCDVTFFGAGNLVSAGAAFAAQLKNFLWAPFSGSFGVTASYNGGSAYQNLKNTGENIDGRWHVGLVFSMDI